MTGELKTESAVTRQLGGNRFSGHAGGSTERLRRADWRMVCRWRSVLGAFHGFWALIFLSFRRKTSTVTWKFHTQDTYSLFLESPT